MRRTVILIFIFIVVFAALVHANTPKQAFNDFVTALKTCDGEKSWALLSNASQDSFNQLYAMLAGMMEGAGEGTGEMAGVTSGKTLWIKAISESGNSGMDMSSAFENMTVTGEAITGYKATLSVKNGTTVEKIDLVNENGMWKLDMSKALSLLTGKDTSCPAPIEKEVGGN